MADNFWKPSKKKYGVAIFNFKNSNVKGSLNLEVGDTVHILEEYGSGSSGWYRGVSMKNKALKGIFPRCLIHIKECEVDNEGPYETITPLDDSMVKEMTYVFREWWGTWKQHFLQLGSSDMLESMVSTMKELIVYRKKLVGDALTHDQSKELKLEIAQLVDWVNSNLGMDLVPRANGEQMDTDTCSIIQLYRIHLQSAKNAKALMPKRRKTISTSRTSGEGKSVHTCHVLVKFRSSQCFVGDESLVYFSLYHSAERKFISEQFKVHLNKNGMAYEVDKLDTYYGLFTELSTENIEKHLYIVARIYRYGKMLSDNKKMAHTYRRPYGVGVVSMKEVEHMSSHDEEYECSMKVQVLTDNNESSFSELHDSLIKRLYGQSNKLALSVSAQEKNINYGLMLAFKIFHGELQTVRHEQPILFNKGIAIIQKPSFSDIINPVCNLLVQHSRFIFVHCCALLKFYFLIYIYFYFKFDREVRNDLYVTLDCADFERGGKKAQKNVEVVVKVFDKNGSQIKNCISYGCGVDAEDSFSSSVYYHNNNPKWNETIRLHFKESEFKVSQNKFLKNNVEILIFLPILLLFLGIQVISLCMQAVLKVLESSFIFMFIFLFYLLSVESTRSKGEKRPYGFCFLKVTDDDDIVIADNSHDLCLYKCDNLNKLTIQDYVYLPCLIDDYGDTRPKSVFVGGPLSPSSPYARSGKENITITTKLCSTKFTQTRDLLGILKWRSSKDSIEKNIDTMMKLKGAEIIKFLQDILNALFGMLSDDTIHCKVKIFQALVYVLNLLTDSRFENFNPVLENYFTETFSSPVAYRDLMTCFSKGIRNHMKGGPFTAAMALKVMEQLFSMMTTADKPEFYKGLTDLFDSFGVLLYQTNDRLKISQMALLSNLHKVYGPLMTVITQPKMAELVRDVINQMPNKREIPEDVHRNKMEFIQETINSDLFKNDESRSVLLPLCLSQIRYCLIERCLLSQAAGTLGDILNNLFLFKQTINIQQDVSTVVISLFEVIIQTVLNLCERGCVADEVLSLDTPCLNDDDLDRKSLDSIFMDTKRHTLAPHQGHKTLAAQSSPKPKRQTSSSDTLNRSTFFFATEINNYKYHLKKGDMIACMTEMLRLMDESHYNRILQIFSNTIPLKDFLQKVLLTFQELLKPGIFPLDWTVMRMVTNNIIFTAVEYFSQALTTHFLKGESFDIELWSHYFNLAVTFITQPDLQLERFSEAKRDRIKEKYQDMRILMGHQIQILWENLASNRRHFIPSLIGPFLQVTLVPEKELRTATLPIFFDMMECEQKTSGHFHLVENELIEKLDIIITTENQGDEEFKDLFKTILLDRVQSEPSLQENGGTFILSVTNLLERLLDYRQVIDGDENRDKRMHCTFNILVSKSFEYTKLGPSPVKKILFTLNVFDIKLSMFFFFQKNLEYLQIIIFLWKYRPIVYNSHLNKTRSDKNFKFIFSHS
ncbi:hypothetical protein KUTeg_021304 [Tegillarca granosa]|uniref:Uncharacterized protein n=1 Tax=Tegillarca granosa TaxID=220873 RepID=A0ABQ9EAG5_TEGGR|nr:hypothetical protein KUTeg_021304 [Tegillarca granosa]